MKTQLLKGVVAMLCIMLIILYASAVFLPHDHDGCDSECVVCAIIEKSELLLAGMAICAVLTGLGSLDEAFVNAVIKPIPQIKNTPVKLRVKLSN